MTDKSIATTAARELRGQCPWSLRRSAHLLVAMGAAACIGRCSIAEEPGRYPPPQPLAGWSDQPPSEPRGIQSDPVGVGGTVGANRRLLPARYQSAEIDPAPGGGANEASSAPVDAAGGPRPIPLSRRSSNPSSTLGGLSGGDKAQLIDAATSLGIVLGLFVLVAWAVRRGIPKGSGLLPTEAVEVLGRASLPGRQQAHLVRCGNKIVLLSITAGGTQTLAEISDPAEVDRLYSICQPSLPPAQRLRQFFGHFTGSARSSKYFARDEADEVDFRHLEMGGQRRA